MSRFCNYVYFMIAFGAGIPDRKVQPVITVVRIRTSLTYSFIHSFIQSLIKTEWWKIMLL